MLGEVSRCHIPIVSLSQQLPATPQRGQTQLGRAPSVPRLLLISMNQVVFAGFRSAIPAAKPPPEPPASTRRHLQHPLNRVHPLRGALCNLPGRAFERAALAYLQMALIRLACLFKHQKQSCRETGRRLQIARRDKSGRRISAILQVPAATVQLRESKAGDGEDNETQTEHKSGPRWQHAPAVQPKTKLCRLLSQLWTRGHRSSGEVLFPVPDAAAGSV